MAAAGPSSSSPPGLGKNRRPRQPVRQDGRGWPEPAPGLESHNGTKMAKLKRGSGGVGPKLGSQPSPTRSATGSYIVAPILNHVKGTERNGTTRGHVVGAGRMSTRTGDRGGEILFHRHLDLAKHPFPPVSLWMIVLACWPAGKNNKIHRAGVPAAPKRVVLFL
jgi:hypothetical protein